jgi:exosortase A-associated hydrolase 2
MNEVLHKRFDAHPGFLEFNGRRLFAMQFLPTSTCTGAVLYLPPFAEEMNRYRQQAVAQARMFAAIGLRCLLLDPYGTGESDGRLEDGDWEAWRDDAEAAGQWLVQESGQALTVWGVRTGALLAADLAAGGRLKIARMMFWQPVVDGKVFVNQHLRLRLASQMVSNGERETTELIRRRLAAGEVIEVAGYPLTGSMASNLESRRLTGLGAIAPTIIWVDIVAKPGQPMPVPSRRAIDELEAAGARILQSAVACPMLWQVHERAEAPELAAETLRLMGEVH